MAILNKAQVNALFQCEAVLTGTADRAPTFRVEALLGEGAEE